MNNSLETQIVECTQQLANALIARGWLLACAESCTGGWIGKCCTDLAGSSAWFDRSYVAYSYPAKTSMLGVTEQRLLRYGAVSAEIAADLAEGARAHSGAQAVLAVTGVAGPGGGTETKPVGTVWFGWALEGRETETERQLFAGDRQAVRLHTVLHGLRGLLLRLA